MFGWRGGDIQVGDSSWSRCRGEESSVLCEWTADVGDAAGSKVPGPGVASPGNVLRRRSVRSWKYGDTVFAWSQV